jgi:hypothetical protein
MSRLFLLEEFHLTLLADQTLLDARRDAIRQVLSTPEFRIALQRALLQVLRSWPELAEVRARIRR